MLSEKFMSNGSLISLFASVMLANARFFEIIRVGIMFSGDMLLNPQIFGRGQPPKRPKNKRTHIVHQKTTTTINAKISSNGPSISSPNKHSQKYNKSKLSASKLSAAFIPKRNNEKQTMNPTKEDIKESPDKLNPNVIEQGITMNDKDDINTNNETQRYKVKMNFLDNKELFINNDNENKMPLPGTETKQQLLDIMLSDEYYANICNGHIPTKQIFTGLLYLLLIIAIDAYLDTLWMSSIMAMICVIILLLIFKRGTT